MDPHDTAAPSSPWGALHVGGGGRRNRGAVAASRLPQSPLPPF
jgi:hypothetical protein